MNEGQFAVIKKDIQSITSNKQIFAVLLIVPLVLTLVLPSIFVFVISFAPDAASDFQKLLDILPAASGKSDQQRIFDLILNNIMPVFFLIIPIMASSVMAASSFVGEKEKHTLETLLYSPLSLGQLFRAKILAGFSVGMMVSYISFAAMLLAVELEVFFLTGDLLLPAAGWLAIMLLIAPAISLAAIAVTVRGSAKAQTIEEAQQRAVFLVFSILALVVGQFTGIIMINAGLLWGVGIVLAALDLLLMRGRGRKIYLRKTAKIRIIHNSSKKIRQPHAEHYLPAMLCVWLSISLSFAMGMMVLCDFAMRQIPK